MWAAGAESLKHQNYMIRALTVNINETNWTPNQYTEYLDLAVYKKTADSVSVHVSKPKFENSPRLVKKFPIAIPKTLKFDFTLKFQRISIKFRGNQTV